eukprot:8041401-Heterocapsa_arctica.AAC.1
MGASAPSTARLSPPVTATPICLPAFIFMVIGNLHVVEVQLLMRRVACSSQLRVQSLLALPRST